MEIGEEVLRVFDVGCEVPAIVLGTVSHPTDLVLETVVRFESLVDTAVQNFSDLELDVAIYFDGGRRRFYAVGDDVWSIGLEKANVKNGMDCA